MTALQSHKSTALLGAALLAAGVCLAPSVAQAQGAVDRVCDQAQRSLNTVVSSRVTKCAVVENGASLIFVTESVAFSTEKQRDAFLAVLVASVGAAINDGPTLRPSLKTVSFMDLSLSREKRYWTIAAPRAAELQRQIRTDQLTAEQYMSAVRQAGRFVSMSP